MDSEEGWQQSYDKWRERRKRALQTQTSVFKSVELDRQNNEVKAIEEIRTNYTRLKERSVSLDVTSPGSPILPSGRISSGDIDREALERARKLIDQEKQKEPDRAWSERLRRLSNTLGKPASFDEDYKNPTCPETPKKFAALSEESSSSLAPNELESKTSIASIPVIPSDNMAKGKNNVKLKLVKRPGQASEENWGLLLKCDSNDPAARGSLIRVAKVKMGSSADLCEIKQNDVLLAIDDQPILDTTKNFLSLNEVNRRLQDLCEQNKPVTLLVQRVPSEDDDEDSYHSIDEASALTSSVSSRNTALNSVKSDTAKQSLPENEPIPRLSVKMATLSINNSKSATPASSFTAQEPTVVGKHSPNTSSSDSRDLPSVRNGKPKRTTGNLNTLAREPVTGVVEPYRVNLCTTTEKPTILHKGVTYNQKPIILQAPSELTKTGTPPKIVPFEAIVSVDNDDKSSISSIEIEEIRVVNTATINNSSKSTPPVPGQSNGYSGPHSIPVSDSLKPPVNQFRPSISYVGLKTSTSLGNVLQVLEPSAKKPSLVADCTVSPVIPPRGPRNNSVLQEHKLSSISPVPPRPPSRTRSKTQTPDSEESLLSIVAPNSICNVCKASLGSGDLMIIEKLSLYYHLVCFRCSRCKCALSDGLSDAEVRIRRGQLFCHQCYLFDVNSNNNNNNNSTANGKKPTSNKRSELHMQPRAVLPQLPQQQQPVFVTTCNNSPNYYQPQHQQQQQQGYFPYQQQRQTPVNLVPVATSARNTYTFRDLPQTPRGTNYSEYLWTNFMRTPNESIPRLS